MKITIHREITRNNEDFSVSLTLGKSIKRISFKETLSTVKDSN